jgi:small ligand-binding sensory domain FIST
MTGRAKTAGFAVAHATGDHWGTVAKACLDGIGDAAPKANLGFLYMTEPLRDHLSSALTFLRETTHIARWVGAVVPGLCVDDTEYREGGAMAVMVGRLPKSQVRLIADLEGTLVGPGTMIVHADPHSALIPTIVGDLGRGGRAVAGGLVAPGPGPTQITDQVTQAAASGLLLAPDVPVVTGMSQGCSPIGAAHTVTGAWQNVVMSLDGRPALEVLKDEAGELIARDLRRAAGYIHVAVPVPGGTDHDYLVRNLAGIDTRQGWLAVGERLDEGQKLMFVRRDANGARADLDRMLDGIRRDLDGRPPLAALYIACVARGQYMFGDPGAEIRRVRDALDGAPVIGFFANGEIAGGRLYAYTGVLTVIAGKAP